MAKKLKDSTWILFTTLWISSDFSLPKYTEVLFEVSPYDTFQCIGEAEGLVDTHNNKAKRFAKLL